MREIFPQGETKDRAAEDDRVVLSNETR